MRTLLRWIVYGSTYTGISFFNSMIELYTAIRSMLTWCYWMATGCTEEFTVEDEDGEIIHHFPQINFKE